MRLIDADALIEKCGEWYTEEGSEVGFIGTLKQLLDKQPTVNQWIPIKWHYITDEELEEEIRKLKKEKDIDEEKIRMLRDDLDKERESVIDAYDREQAAKEEAAHALQKIEDLKRQLQEAEKNAVDTAEIDILKEKLEKEKTKAKEAQEKLKKEKAARQTEIDAAIEKKQEELQKEAETKAGKVLQKAEEERKGLQNENEALKRKLANAGNESIVKFKILVDQLQDIFDQAGQCILIEQDAERAHKMNAALRQVVDKMKEEL